MARTNGFSKVWIGRGRQLFLLALLAFVGGCSAPKTKVFQYYPKPPNPPRLQFLTSFAKASDMKSASVMSSLLGEARDVVLDGAYGVAFHQGKVLVANPGQRSPGYVVFDLEKKELKSVTGLMRRPVGIAVDEQGNRYLSDPEAQKVFVFDVMDKPIGSFDSADPKFRPAGVVAVGEKVYVADVKGGLIRIFNRQSRQEIGQIGAEHLLAWPTGLSYNAKDEELIVAEAGAARVAVLSLDGKLLKRFGKRGDSPGSFVRPKDAVKDRDGNLYVVDVAYQNVQLFNEDSQILMFVDSRPGRASLILPAGLAIDYEHVKYFEPYAAPGFKIEYVIAITSQGAPPTGGAKVSFYGFGTQEGKDYDIYK